MNFENYAHQMYMKYKLALTIAVIRNKPENLSPEQYLSKLKENIEQTETADRSLLTADFNFDDNDFTFDDNESLINHQFNDDINIENLSLASKLHVNNETNDDSTSIDLLQDYTAPVEEVRNNVTKNSENSIVNDISTDGGNSLDEVLSTLRDIEENKNRNLHNDFMFTQDKSQNVPSSSSNYINSNVNEENMDACDVFQNNNIDFIDLVSEANTQVIVDEKIRTNVEKNVNKRMKLSKADNTQIKDFGNDDTIVSKNTYEMEVDMALNDIRKNQYVESNTHFTMESTANANAPQQVNEAINNTVVNENLNFATTAVTNSTEDTILYTLHDFTQNTSHISQSQYQNIEIPQAFIQGNRHKNISDNKKNEADNAKNENKNGNQDLRQTTEIVTVNSSDIHYIMDQSGKTYAVLRSMQLKNVEHDTVTIDKTKETQEIYSQEVNKKHDCKNVEDQEDNTTENIEFLDIDDELDKELTEDEVVPFKLVKELSKIKAYLNRKERRGSTDGCSSDSGYRSDSQSSFKSARVSDDWVPQSAHCLYDYIIQCPLVAVTQEIVNEISQVLGRLIDRLHEEEKYPPFLEQLLDKVDALLRELSCQTECFENILLDKDETIQRLLLLNKSTHILKFSIEKIVNILEKTHSYLTSKENLYELTSIEEVENLRYTFFTLEIFLQIYVKNKDSASQCTQSSQENKILKRSSITEIWKKKWNPNIKELKNAGSQDKGCVLTKCGEVLNKIVVDCMEGYSLVSFAALQCFNLLQN